MSFTKTVLDILAFKKDETFSPFLYSTPQFHNDPVNGVGLWNKVIEYPGYYLSKEEPLIIQAVAKDIKTILENDKLTFIDLGPGSISAVKTKTVPLLTSLEENVENYIPIDNQKHFLDDSIECVSNSFKNLIIAPIIGDIFKINEIDNLKKIKNKCLVFLSGATIGNIAEQKNIPYNLTNKLKNISNGVATGSYFLITQDTNQDLFSLKEAYNNIHGKNFVLNIFHLIKRECHLANFDPTAFNHIVEWNDKNSAVICAAKALIPQSFKIDNQNIYIHKNQKIPIIKSYKYSYEDFTKIVKSTGLKFIKTYWGSSKRIAIHLLQNAS